MTRYIKNLPSLFSLTTLLYDAIMNHRISPSQLFFSSSWTVISLLNPACAVVPPTLHLKVMNEFLKKKRFRLRTTRRAAHV
jgi:hypothetical protein